MAVFFCTVLFFPWAESHPRLKDFEHGNDFHSYNHGDRTLILATGETFDMLRASRSAWTILTATAMVVSLTFCLSASAEDRITGKAFATRSEVIAQHGMAATSQPLATQVAIDVLKKGGSAVDAAIAANACLGLMEPTGNGIGGDLFAIVWDNETQKLYDLNASGRSPQSLTLEHFQKEGITKIPSFGPLPVSVPGCVDGWFQLHGKFGKLRHSEAGVSDKLLKG